MEKDEMDFVNQIIHGDCEDILKKLPENAVDLIFTSPRMRIAERILMGASSQGTMSIGFSPKPNNSCAY